MKPTFALDLSRDCIALLHRTPKGWLTIGEVGFDAPDMAETLDFLRKTALGLSPLGLACKVILPNNQVLYSEIHAPGPSREDKRRQIAAGLHGRTPYGVDDLVFDWSGKGTVVRVAVVARETLDEAEAFAVAHRLNPVSFVTIPEDGTFHGEAWFGPTNAADTILAPGETVERDRDAVTILSRAPMVRPPAAEVEAAPDPTSEMALPGLEEALNAAVTETDLAAAAALHPNAALPAELDLIEHLDDPLEDILVLPEPADPVPADPVPADPEAPAPMVELAQDTDPPEPAPPEPDPPEPDPPEADLPSVEVVTDATEALSDLPPADLPPTDADKPADPQPLAEPEEAPFADIIDDLEAEEDLTSPKSGGDARVLVSDILDDDLPPPPSPAAMLAFSSRRSAAPVPAIPGPARTPPPVTSAKGAGPIPRPVPPAPHAPGPVAARPNGAGVTAPGIPGLGPKPKPRPELGTISRPVAPGPTTVKSPVRPQIDFSAPPPKLRRPGFVFMVLIGLLLVSLALVGAWASFFLTQASNDPALELPAEVLDVPPVEDEMAADLQDPSDFAVEDTGAEATETPLSDEAATDLEALAVEEMPTNIGGDDSGVPATDSVAEALAAAVLPGDPAAGTEAETAGADEGTDEAAPGTTIATDVSSRAAPVEDQDEIFLAAMDAPPPILDALALPAPAATTDAPPDAPMPPPAVGTVYQFDAQGLLMPTPEGILSPDGIMLFAGQPPVVPPSRSPLAEAAAAAAAPAPAPTIEVTTAADASLVTAGETAETDAATEAPVETAPVETAPVETAPVETVPVESAPPDPALAGFRPKPRPVGLVVPDDGASLASGAETDVVTLRPLARPTSVSAAAATSAGTEMDDLGAQGASLAAQAEARLAEAAALEAANPSIVAISMRPAPRPADLSNAVEAAVAAAVREPDPSVEAEVELAAAAPAEGEEIDEPETDDAAPSIPTKASVAKQATYKNAINLSKINLIGTFGTASSPYALIRQANGKYKKVEVGDRIDGGVVKAITETEVRYQKGGKLVILEMPAA